MKEIAVKNLIDGIWNEQKKLPVLFSKAGLVKFNVLRSDQLRFSESEKRL